MPHMYPEGLPEGSTSSGAEYDLYHLFRQQLADDFYVFHSVAWLGRRGRRSVADGEADFVIAHPRIGILVLEVKGGIVGHDGEGGWYSIQRGTKQHHSIKDPFHQARDSKHFLLGKIREMANWPGRWPTIGHAVAFPDGNVDLAELGPDAPREIILLHTDRDKLDAWVRRCMGYWGADGFVPPGEEGVRILREILARSWFLRPPKLGEEIDLEKSTIAKFTDEQFQLLRFIAGRPRAAIRGCAGAGKTTIAVRKAQQLARQGFRVLLTCYNRNLAEELRRVGGVSPSLEIYSFHGLCARYAALTGFDQRPVWDESRPDFFDDVMPEALLEAAASDDAYRFDAIVVDEGQDFADTWWSALEMLLRDPKQGVFYVFYDDNQLLYPRRLALPVEELPFHLTENCRNTQQIHRAVQAYYRSDTPFTSRGPEGRPVETVWWDPQEPHSLQKALAATLARLIYEEEIDSRDIVILSAGGLNRPPLSDMPVPKPFKPVAEPSPVPNEIYTTTIRLFKGLERPVVILLAPEDERADTELMYVGQSRALHHLILFRAVHPPQQHA